MKMELFGILVMSLIGYLFYVAVGGIQRDVISSLRTSKATAERLVIVESKVDDMSRDISEIKESLRRLGVQ